VPRTITVARLVVPVIAETDKFTSNLNKAEGAVGKFRAAVTGAAKIATVGLGAVTAAAGAAAVGLTKLAKNAAPLPGIMQAFDRNAMRFGVSLEAMQQAAQGTVTDMELMRKANLALVGAGQELGQEFGEKLPLLLKGARAAARATGQDVDYLFSSLVTGVKRASPLLIDNTGIVLKLGDANQKMADKVGVTVDQLTAQQKSLAILDATAESVTRMLEDMGDMQLTTAERFQRLGVSVQNLSHRLGMSLLPAADAVLDTFDTIINNVGPHLTTFFETRLGPALAAAAEQFNQLAERGLLALDNLIFSYENKFETFIYNALVWGYNFSTQFAAGLIQGASYAISTAMNFLTGLLTFWMAPGSPPRIASDIDKWGMATAAEWLKGFTNVDFSALDSFQTRLGNALQAMVGLGQLKAPEAATILKSLSTDMIKALDQFRKTGAIPAEMFDNIRKAGGALGDQLADLARKNFDLLRAEEAVRAAGERLTKAQSKQKTAQGALTKLIADYTKMQRAGADPKALAAKRAEIEAAKKGVRAAHDEVKAAEEQKKQAEDAVDPVRERLSLQEKLIDQLVRLAQIQADIQKEQKVAKIKLPKAEKVTLPEIELPRMVLPTPDTKGVSKAFKDAQQKFTVMLIKLRYKFNQWVDEEIRPAIWRIRLAWYKLTKAFGDFIEDPDVQAVVEFLNNLFPKDAEGNGDSFVQNLGKIAGALAVVAVTAKIAKFLLSPLIGIFGGLAKAAGLSLGPIGWLALALGVLVAFAVRARPVFQGLQEQWDTMWQAIWTIVKTWVIDKWTETFGEGGTIPTMWENFKTSAVTVWETIKTSIVETVEAIVTSVTDSWTATFGDGGTIPTMWDTLKTTVETIWTGIQSTITTAVNTVQTNVETALGAVQTAWDNTMGALETAAKSFWQWIQDHVFSFKIHLPSLPAWAIPGSPLPIHTAWKDFAEDMKGGITTKLDAAVNFPQAAPAPVAAAAFSERGGDTYNLNFGRDSVRSDHDIYLLAELVQKAIDRRSLRRNIR